MRMRPKDCLTFFFLLIIFNLFGEEQKCPKPKVEVSNKYDYLAALYGIPERNETRHFYDALATAIENAVISLNHAQIRFFSAVSSVAPVEDVDYHLSAVCAPKGNEGVIQVVMVDNNTRTVLNSKRS